MLKKTKNEEKPKQMTAIQSIREQFSKYFGRT